MDLDSAAMEAAAADVEGKGGAHEWKKSAKVLEEHL